MTEIAQETRHPLRKLTIVALSFNIVASAGWWWVILASDIAPNNDDVAYWAVTSVPLALVITVVGICLAAIAGRSRGANRVIGVVGGVILLSPLVASIVSAIIYG